MKSSRRVRTRLLALYTAVGIVAFAPLGQRVEALAPPEAVVFFGDGTPASNAHFEIRPVIPERIANKDGSPLQIGSADALGRIDITIPVNARTLELAGTNDGVLNLEMSTSGCPPIPNPQQAVELGSLGFTAEYDEVGQVFQVAQLGNIDMEPTTVQGCTGGGGGYYCWWHTENEHFGHSDDYEGLIEVHTPIVSGSILAQATYGVAHKASTKFAFVYEEGGNGSAGGSHEVANSSSDSATVGWPSGQMTSSMYLGGFHIVKQLQRVYCDFLGPTSRTRFRDLADRWIGTAEASTVDRSSIDNLTSMNNLCDNPVVCRRSFRNEGDSHLKVGAEGYTNGWEVEFFGFSTTSRTQWESTVTLEWTGSNAHSGVGYIWCNNVEGECKSFDLGNRMYAAYDAYAS